MDVTKFIAEQWQLIAASPIPFFTCASIFAALGFGLGKFFYGTVAEVAKARLEATRDDLGRLEKRRVDEAQDNAYLRVEVAALRADVERIPQITVGAGPPEGNPGKDGDLYFQYEATAKPQPPLSTELFLHPPEVSLKSALERARVASRPIFLVIYDPGHHTQSKLAFSLGYFLEYQTTRRLVDQHFVVAVVPVTDSDVRSLVPADDPLENCRWVVLNAVGQVLRTEGVYANPDEGLKRTREAIAQSESAAAAG